MTVVAMDDILFSRSVSDCQRFCDDARAFNCKSYAQKGDRCYLSGDDSVTMQGVPQPVDIGAVYKEKVCTRSKYKAKLGMLISGFTKSQWNCYLKIEIPVVSIALCWLSK